MSKHRWLQSVARKVLGFDELWLSSFGVQESTAENDLKRELHMAKHNLSLSVSAHRLTEYERDTLRGERSEMKEELRDSTEECIEARVEIAKLKVLLRVARRRGKR
jgi:hypothetical protein